MNAKPTTAMVLAAGLGTRMRPITDRMPKPMVPLAGRPLLDHVLDRIADAGISRAVVNVHYLPDQIERHLASRSRPEIEISDERDALLDTGGGVMRALPRLGKGPFIVHNSDSVWGEGIGSNLARMLAMWDGERMDCLMLMAMLVPFITSPSPTPSLRDPDSARKFDPKPDKIRDEFELKERKSKPDKEDTGDFSAILGLLLNGGGLNAPEDVSPEVDGSSSDESSKPTDSNSIAASTGSDVLKPQPATSERLTSPPGSEANPPVSINPATVDVGHTSDDLARQQQLATLAPTVISTEPRANSELPQNEEVSSPAATLAVPVPGTTADSRLVAAALSQSNRVHDPAIAGLMDNQPTEPVFKDILVMDDLDPQTTFESAAAITMAPDFIPDEMRVNGQAESKTDSRPTSLSAIRASSRPMSEPAHNPNVSTAAAATETASFLVTQPGMDGPANLPADPGVAVSSLQPSVSGSLALFNSVLPNSGLPEGRTTANRIDQAMKTFEVSGDMRSVPTVHESLEQFWSEHSENETPSEQSPHSSSALKVGEVTDLKAVNSSGHLSGNSPGVTSAAGVSGTAGTQEFPSSVSQELRQPLSSQVSRAVLEHLEKQSSPELESLTVRLDPAELGEMVIQLSKTKEGLAVRVTAREPVTMDMLLARGHEIETQLRGENLDLRSLEFLAPGIMNGGASQDHKSRDTSAQQENSHSSSRRTPRGSNTTDSSATAGAISHSNHALSFRA